MSQKFQLVHVCGFGSPTVELFVEALALRHAAPSLLFYFLLGAYGVVLCTSTKSVYRGADQNKSGFWSAHLLYPIYKHVCL